MWSKILQLLFSTKLMLVLLILFPLAMGIGTFLESWYSTDAARVWVYNAWWFELLMLLLMVNFMGNIKKYNLLSKEKISVLILHLSFVFILLGAFVTRYIGDEGVMPIRENNSSNTYLSEKTYLTIFIDGEKNEQPSRKTLKTQLLLKGIITVNDWDEWKELIAFDFIEDNYFSELKEAEIVRERFELIASVDEYVGKYISNEWVRKNVLRQTDDDILELDKQMEGEDDGEDDDLDLD